MSSTTPQTIAENLQRLEFAFDSQRLEGEPLLPKEKERLRGMLTRGMSPDEGIKYLLRQLGHASEVHRQ